MICGGQPRSFAAQPRSIITPPKRVSSLARVMGPMTAGCRQVCSRQAFRSLSTLRPHSGGPLPSRRPPRVRMSHSWRRAGTCPRPLADIDGPGQGKRMRRILALLICASCGGVGCHTEPAKLSVAQAVVCIPKGKWPALLAAMKSFGATHDLRFIGGAELIRTVDKDRPLLNASLAQGYNYYFGNNLDLWITSRPFEPGIVDLATVVKRPATNEQRALSRAFLAQVTSMGAPAAQSGEKASCR